MYRLGKRKHKSHGTFIISLVIVVLIIGLGALYALTHLPLQAATTTQGSPPSVHYVSASTDNAKTHLDEGIFSVDVPTGWKLASHQTTPYNVYNFQGTNASDVIRLISVYVDTIPPNYPVNRVVAVQSQGASISHDSVSDNCVNFTSDAARNASDAQQKGYTVSRWDSVNFYCDIKNSGRNVTGTSSQAGINSLALTGPVHGAHSYFFVYTDNNINADYNVFYSVLESFKAQ